MKFLTVFIYVLLSLFVGSLFLGLALNLIDIKVVVFLFKKYIASNMYYNGAFGVLGGLILLICFRHLQLRLFSVRKEKSITIESAEGKVSITLFAIEDLVKRLLEEKSEISHIRPKIGYTKRGIEAIIRCNLTSEVSLLEFTRDVQEKVKGRLQILLGEDKEVIVVVEIRKVLLPSRKKGDEEEPEVPFRHY
ncbi:MAG: alkaline shock response membrane anchor protein AmaP [Candidatus Omnitrophota bacterium]|nr:MAG: alkaline shock response membrane anchor protein AmaP [Candidatus Omnitrophota bacterium]